MHWQGHRPEPGFKIVTQQCDCGQAWRPHAQQSKALVLATLVHGEYVLSGNTSNWIVHKISNPVCRGMIDGSLFT